MKAGDNTLNSVIAVEFVETLQREVRRGSERDFFLEDYWNFISFQLLVEDQIIIFP